MISREEVKKISGAILNPNCGGLDAFRFRKEYRERTGVEFPIKYLLGGDPPTDVSTDVLVIQALEEMGFGIEKRTVRTSQGKAEQRLFLLPAGVIGVQTGIKERGGSSLATYPTPSYKAKEKIDDYARPALKRKSSGEEFASSRDLATSSRDAVTSSTDATSSSREAVALALADYPFVLKNIKTRCRDLVSVVSTLAERNRNEGRPAIDRMKISLRLQYSEYPPETMFARFLNNVAATFGDDRDSYVSRAFTLPSSFHILVTHVEDDGFRFWGRVFVPDGGKENEFVSMAEETGEVGRATEKNSSATEMEPENLVESVADEESTMTEDADALFSCANTMEQCDNGAKEKQTRPQRFESLYDDDSNQLERMEEEMKAFLEQDIEDYVDTADLCAAHLPVAVFHEGRWYRGWTMSTEANAVQDAIARVFLIDVGRVVLKETFQLRPWNAALAEARGLKEVRRPPLALPFFLKGCNRQNRGPSFLRSRVMGRIVQVVKSRINRTENSGKCVTPVVVLDHGNVEEGKKLSSRNDPIPRAAPRMEGDETPSFDPESTLNFYHGEAVMETQLPEDALHRSIIARYAQFGLDAYDVVGHIAGNNVRILEAVRAVCVG